MESILTSWKQIADYFGKSVRTVQRWHTMLGLPVHHIPETRQVQVSCSELQDWLLKLTASRQAREQLQEQLGAEFDPADVLLTSWKEIASYLKRSVRTVQRWEQLFGLPVRRPVAGDSQIVLALRPEVDRWASQYPILVLGREPEPPSLQNTRAQSASATPAPTPMIHRRAS